MVAGGTSIGEGVEVGCCDSIAVAVGPVVAVSICDEGLRSRFRTPDGVATAVAAGGFVGAGATVVGDTVASVGSISASDPHAAAMSAKRESAVTNATRVCTCVIFIPTMPAATPGSLLPMFTGMIYALEQVHDFCRLLLLPISVPQFRIKVKLSGESSTERPKYRTDKRY
jgi:hypothetical protein